MDVEAGSCRGRPIENERVHEILAVQPRRASPTSFAVRVLRVRGRLYGRVVVIASNTSTMAMILREQRNRLAAEPSGSRCHRALMGDAERSAARDEASGALRKADRR